MALDGQNASPGGSRPIDERPVWQARSVPGVKIGLGSHAGDVERPARVRFRDLAPAKRGCRTALALASQRARPRRLCAAQTPRRQKPVFICDERNVKKLINTFSPFKLFYGHVLEEGEDSEI
jgi:hypothetical protein